MLWGDRPTRLHFIPFFLFLLQASYLPFSVIASPRPKWGTFRPQALISTRASVPHSPCFGFVYHSASDQEIRHLATDHPNHISSFSWSRHDARFFGDQQIIDTGLNLLLTSSFQHHPNETDAWALRLSAEVLDPSKPAHPISVVFYATAGPDDLLPHNIDDGDVPSLWGQFDADVISNPSSGSREVLLKGAAESIGGAFQVSVKAPAYGSLHASALPVRDTDEATRKDSSTGSRGRQRMLADKPVTTALPVDVFHVAPSPGLPREMWAVEKMLSTVLKPSGIDQGPSDSNSPALYMVRDSLVSGASGVFVQRLLEPAFEIEAVFVQSEGRSAETVIEIDRELSGLKLQHLLDESRASFDARFDDIFKLKEKGISDGEEKFAKAALSNMLGGIGFFFGSSVIMDKTSTAKKRDHDLAFLPPIALLTATPSRSLFPRGFLWDEGFHQLVVQRWDPELSLKCMRSWMAAVQESGWIPREQILGLEARSRFPKHVQHLMIQNPKVANPPTILMPLRVIASVSSLYSAPNATDEAKCKSGSADDGSGTCKTTQNTDRKFFRDILSHVIQYYSWLKKTQSGQEQNSFRWRGRSSDLKSPDGYPLTLASGLDDFPRAEKPSLAERHVDLHCWMTWASGALAKVVEKAGEDPTSFWEEHKVLTESLVYMHGQDVDKTSTREDLLLCDFDGDEKVCHEGYPTILPLILGLLDPSDARVAAILDSLEDPSLLKAKAGVRSLAKNDRWHRKGDDYWTGSVWMPFNFLTLAALKTKYAVEDGPYRERAKVVFTDLQKSILDNAYEVFSETGQLWENYSPEDDGAGKSGRQFTGWSSLILLMYADMYDGVT